MSSGFVHLHVHTAYSLLQGAIHVESLVERVKKMGMTACAVTDSGLFGAVDFYLQAKKAGIKPIIGTELMFAPDGYAGAMAVAATTSNGQTEIRPKWHHLTVLTKDLQGYRNLCKMVTRAFVESPAAVKGQPVLPRGIVDRALLDKFGDGLIVLSGCLRSEVGYRVVTGDEDAAWSSLQWMQKRFGEDFYLELQDSGLPEQELLNDWLYHAAEKLNIRYVATNDCHYLDPKDAEAHEVLQCIAAGKNLDFDRPKSLVPSEYWFKPEELMRDRMSRYPGACDETVKIAEKCNVDFKFKDEQGRSIYHLPNYRPEGIEKGDPHFDLIHYFKEQSRTGLRERFLEPQFDENRALQKWPELEKEYWQRLEDELTMIERTGFSGYFLIVSDFIKWAKAQQIPVGPGRGSGAGSLVAYCLQITDIDPIQYNLLFERFINPERVSMPDFDVDFCQDRRGEVIDYVKRKYGVDNVCQIITFGKLQTRAVLKDVGRVLGLTFAETDQITKLIPEELHITLDEAIEKEPRLREKIEQEVKTAKVIEYSRALEGLFRNSGIHAAGVIITEEPVVSYSPMYVTADNDLVTQFDKDKSEAIGLVKFDFLGLKTLTVIDNAVKFILQTEPFDLKRINYKDTAVYALISSGDTDGVFQVESSGMKDLCSRIQPNSVEDLTAINALYRPGPLGSGMVDDFIERKHGRKPIVYDVESLATILKDTYGVILYQEQVMQIARELAGYSLGQADMLRRAMGKKKPEEMAKHRVGFVEGALKKGIEQSKAEGIFDLMAKFAEYGFNKSHSAAYAVLTYQTAFLKTHFPAEFMAALMTTEMSNTDKITRYISDSRDHNIPVLPPDVSKSVSKFSIEIIDKADGTKQKAVRFGLEAIKGVGGIAVECIVEERLKSPFRNVIDFCRRVSTRKVNKKVMESLTLAGAFDPICEVNRASMHASIENLLSFASDEQEERELGQVSLFDSFGSNSEVSLAIPVDSIFKKEPDWPDSRKLALEKQTVGFYMSGHPMDRWQRICEDWLGWTTEKIHALPPVAKPKQEASGENGRGGGFRDRPKRPEVRVGGLFTEMREVMTKKGTRMCFAQFEDLKGRIEVIFFPEAYAQNQEILKRVMAEAEPVVLQGEVEVAEEGAKILIKSIEPISDAHQGRVQQVVLQLVPSQVSADQLRELKKQFLAHRGKCAVRIDFIDPRFRTSLQLPQNVRVAGTPQLVESVNRIFGTHVVHLN